MTLEEFAKEMLYDINKFTNEWKSHKGDLNWPDEMEPEDWQEHFAFFLLEEELKKFRELKVMLSSSSS